MVVVLLGVCFGSQSADAALIFSDYSVSSVQIRDVIDVVTTPMGELSVWFDIGSSSEGASNSPAGNFQAGSSAEGESPDHFLLLSDRSPADAHFLANSAASSRSVDLGSGYSSSGGGTSVYAAILVPCSHFPIPSLLSFWKGKDFLFVPTAPSFELLRPPKSLDAFV